MGTGSIFPATDRRTGQARWVAQVSIGGRRNRRVVQRWRHTEREARAALKELLAESAPSRDRRLTLSAFLDDWVVGVRNLRPRTRTEYANAVALHINPAIGHLRLATLAPSDVEAMIRILEPVLAPKSVRNVVGVLRRALTFALRDGLVTRNVAAREFIDPVRVPRAEPRVLSEPELRAVSAAAAGHWLEALVLTAAGSGLRQGELLGLTWADVELERGRLEVRRALRRVPGATRKSGRYVHDELKTARSRRTVPLAPSLVEALKKNKARLIAAGFVPIAAGPVFPSVRGRPLSAGWVSHQFAAICARAGVEGAPFKALRATFASRLHDAGLPERRIQDLLGHKPDSRVTQAHYIGAGDWDAAVAAVSEVVG